jgi:hypothetical protein
LGIWKRGNALSIAWVTSKKDLRERIVVRLPSYLVLVVCAVSVLFIRMYLSFEFQLGFHCIVHADDQLGGVTMAH